MPRSPRIPRPALLALALAILAAPALSAGSIGGVAFEDPTRDGALDPGDAPLAGQRVLLVGAEGTVLRQTTTGADGSFLFADLPDGDYIFTLEAEDGLRGGLPDQGVDLPPIPDFPFGRPRYSSTEHLTRNLVRAAQSGAAFRHVALGDSIAWGFNVCDSLLGENGYVDPLTARLRRATAGEVITDEQAVPGDESEDLLDPDFETFYGNFNDVYDTVEKRAPVVTISIGGNDYLGAMDGGDPELAGELVEARQNIQEVLSSLLGEIPFSEVEINTVYDPEEGDDALNNLWVPIWDQMLREHAWGQARRVTIGEIHRAYAHEEDGQIVGEPGLICNDFFGLDDIHPTRRGYDLHEEKIWQAWGGVTLAGGSDRLDVGLPFVRETREEEPDGFEDVFGGTVDPEQALTVDGVGALVPPGEELRLSGFRPATLPANDLAQAVLHVRYRTTGAPLDDSYRFEISVDGTFSPPGDTPTTWNTIIPVVGWQDDQLAFPDQPEFREVAAPVYLGAPVDGSPTLVWDDLETLTVRAVGVVAGDPDPFEVEWDGAWVEVYELPAEQAGGEEPGGSWSLGEGLAAVSRDREEGRERVLARLAEAPDATAAALLPEVCGPSEAALIDRLLRSPEAGVRLGAARSAPCLPPSEGDAVLVAASMDSSAAVRRAAAARLGTRPRVPVEVLIRLASDADPGVRRSAVRSLGRRGGAEGTLAAVLRWDDQRDVQLEAAAALAAAGRSTGLGLLLDAALGAPPSIVALRALERHPVYDPLLVARAADGEPRERVAAAGVLGRVEALPDEGREALVDLLDDPEEAVRRAALDALSRHADPAALPGLLAAVGSQPRFAAVALARYERAPALGALGRIAADDAAPDAARRTAARALALSPRPEARPLLEALAGSDAPRVRRLALSGLARRNG